MIYRVRHTNQVSYASPVQHAQFNLRLAPWPMVGHTLLEQSLDIHPQPSARDVRDGPYLVKTLHLGFLKPLKTLEVTSEFRIVLDPPPAPGGGPSVARVASEALGVRDVSTLAPAPYLFASRIAVIDDTIGRWAAPYLTPDFDIVRAASALMGAVHAEFAYVQGATDSATPPATAFQQRRGVCQDFAHVMIMALRAHGIPAGYVSGYLRTLPPPGKEKLVGSDAMHAWVSVWCGADLGWIGFDPTNNTLAQHDHIAICMGRDYADISPIDGTIIGHSEQTMKSAVDVIEQD